MQEKPKDFGQKCCKQENITKKAKWIDNITKELEGLEEDPKEEIHIDLLKPTLKKYQTGKRQDMMEYIDSSSRNSPPFTTDEH